MPTGLGDEKLWLCPTLDNVNPFNDLSDQANNGTGQGGISTVSDSASGGSYAYDMSTTTTSRIALPASFDSTIFSDSSVCGWFKYSGPVFNADPDMALIGSSSTSGQWYVAQRKNDTNVQTGTYRTFADDGSNNGEAPVAGTGGEEDNNWHHVAFVRDYTASTGTVYLDGVSIGSASFTSNQLTATQDLFVGYWNGAYAGNLSASGVSLYYDDIRSFNRTLTQAEIAHLAEARGITGSPPQGLGDEKLWLCPSINNSPNDISGNGNNGVYQNGMGTISDVSNGGSLAYDLDGTADYIRVPKANFAFLVETNSFSQSVWVRSDSAVGQRTFIGGNLDSTGKGTALFQNTGGTFRGSRANGSGGYSPNTISSTAVPASQWFHVAWIVDGTTSTLYVDGVQIFQETGTFVTASGPLANDVLVGCYEAGTTLYSFLDGLIDDVRIYDRVLTQAEITHLASQRGVLGTPFEGLGDEQLWLCPSLQDGTNDLSGNNNDGVYNGGMGTVTDVSNGGSLAYDFDGVGDFITVAGGVGTGTTDAFCIAFWWNWVGAQTVYVWDMDTSANDSFGVVTRSGPNRLRPIVRPNTLGTPNTYMSVGSNTWEHIVYQRVAGSDEIKSYRNGVETGSAYASVDPVTLGNDITIGAGNATYLNAMLDDIRWFNKSLTQSEITHLATSRGIEGPAPVGLGDEKLWLCPSLNDSANDISGNGNNGVYNGGMGTVADVAEGGSLAYDFDGSGDYVQVSGTDFNFLRETNSWTQCCWVKFDVANTDGAIIGGDARTTWHGNTLYNASTSLGIRGMRAAGTAGVYSPDVTTNTQAGTDWFHICWVCDGNVSTVYRDGVPIGSQTGTFTTSTGSTSNVYLGVATDAGSKLWYLAGRMDDARVYDRPLTQAEITHLASQRGVEGPAPVGLGGEKLWLCPSINDSANDISGNGNDGVYSGGMGTITDTSNGGSLAYDFDGTDDYIDCGTSTGIGQSSTFSVSGWFSADAFWSKAGFITAYGNQAPYHSQRGWMIRMPSSPTFLTNSSRSSSNFNRTITSSQSLTINTWHHIVATYDVLTDEMEMFIDGVSVATGLSAGTISSPAVPFRIGKYDFNEFNGKADDIRAYDRVLTQSEITHLATSRGIEGSPSTPTTQYNAFTTHAFTQLFQTRLR